MSILAYAQLPLPASERRCTRCGETKPIAAFSRDRHHPSGFQALCKACRTARRKPIYQKRYYERHRAPILEAQGVYRSEHPERRRQTLRRYFQAHKEQENAKVLRWQRANRERVKAARQQTYERHRDKIKARRKAYYEAHHEEQIAKARARQRERRHLYNFDIEKQRESVARRRARTNGNYVERVDRAAIYERDGGQCHICGSEVSQARCHLDHIVPNSKGGEHSYANVAVSCPPCNQRKSARRLF